MRLKNPIRLAKRFCKFFCKTNISNQSHKCSQHFSLNSISCPKQSFRLSIHGLIECSIEKCKKRRECFDDNKLKIRYTSPWKRWWASRIESSLDKMLNPISFSLEHSVQRTPSWISCCIFFVFDEISTTLTFGSL